MKAPREIPYVFSQQVAIAPLKKLCLSFILQQNTMNPTNVCMIPHEHCKRKYGINLSFIMIPRFVYYLSKAIHTFRFTRVSRVFTLTSTLYYIVPEKAIPTFIKLPPRLRNNCAVPVYECNIRRVTEVKGAKSPLERQGGVSIDI